MIVAVLQVELFLPESFSLKDKRFAVQSLKNRIRRAFNVSVAEVDHQDKWQRCCLAVACVATDRQIIESLFSKVQNLVGDESRVELLDHRVDWL